MLLNLPETLPPQSVEKVSSTKPVPGVKNVGNHCPRGSPSQQDKMGMKSTWEAFSNDIAIPCRDCDRAHRVWHMNTGNTHPIGKTKKKIVFKCNSATIVSKGCYKGILDYHLVRF